MPRKITATSTARTVAQKRPSAAARAQPSVAFESISDRQDDIENDVDDGQNGDEENMMEMITILQEFQKRKATTASTRSAGFQNKKAALFSEARKEGDTIMCDGLASIDQARAKIVELKAQEISHDNHLQTLTMLWKSHDDCVRTLLGHYPALVEDLSHRRANQINEASAMLESHVAERRHSRRRLIKNAQARMDENLEHQKIAADATALIKHYKALLLS